MTISNTARKAGPYSGTGVQTSWPFVFKVFTTADIQVTIADALGVETVLALGADYTVALNANQETSPGGTVTYPISGSPLPAGSRLTVTGYVAYDQVLDLPAGGNFSAAAVEQAFDRTVMQVQQVRETVNRAVQVGVTTDVAVVLPPPAPNRLIGWNEDGDGLQNVPIADLATGIAFVAYRYDVFTGDGTTTSFTLAVDPVVAGNVYVSVAGVVQLPAIDYNLINGNLAFVSAPANGAKILAHYGEAAPGATPSGAPVTFAPTVQSFNGDGTTTAFTLASAPGSAAALVVRISGAVQTPATDFFTAGTTLTFTEAPPAGTGNIVVQNFGAAVPVGIAPASGVMYLDSSTLNQYIGPVGSGAVLQMAPGNPLFQLPTSAGSAGQLLSTNGSGVLSWISPAANALTAGDSNATVNDSGTGSTFTISLDTVETLRLNARILGVGVNPTGWGGGSRGFETSGGMLYSTGSTRLIQAGNAYDAAGNTDYRFRSGGLYAIIDEYSNSLGLRTFYTSTATGSAGGVPTLVEVMKMGTGAYPYVEVKALSLAYPGSYSDISASTLNWDSAYQGATVLRFKDVNCTVTLPTSAGSSKGRILFLSNVTAHSVTSASANVVPLGSNTAGTAILPATAGKFAVLFYDNNRWLTILAN